MSKVYKFRGNASANVDDVRMNRIHSLAEDQKHENITAEFAHDLPYMKEDIWNECGPEWLFGHDPATYPDQDLAQHYAEVQFNPSVECPVGGTGGGAKPVQKPVECLPDDSGSTDHCAPGTLGDVSNKGKKAADKVEKIVGLNPDAVSP